MSLCQNFGIRIFRNRRNTLWPRTTVDTTVRNILGGEQMANISRTPDIMGKAASHYLADPKKLVDFILLMMKFWFRWMKMLKI